MNTIKCRQNPLRDTALKNSKESSIGNAWYTKRSKSINVYDESKNKTKTKNMSCKGVRGSK